MVIHQAIVMDIHFVIPNKNTIVYFNEHHRE